MKIQNSKFKIQNSKAGFTPTPQHGVMSRVFSKIYLLSKFFAFLKTSLHMSWRHKNATPRLVSGFTLVESLVAITIVLVSIVGPLTIISKTLSFARFARDEITAFYLAQDAVEFVRNTRDNNVIAGDDWLVGLSACVGGICSVDSAAGAVLSCGTSCDPLKLSSSGVYGYTNGENTQFVREVSIAEVSGDREATIDVVVRWNQGIFERTFSVREYIFNWQ